MGYDAQEITEEFSEDGEGNVKMTKKKVVTKNVPPDVTALKLLKDMDEFGGDLRKYTDEELEEEKTRLKSLLTKGECDEDI